MMNESLALSTPVTEPFPRRRGILLPPPAAWIPLLLLTFMVAVILAPTFVTRDPNAVNMDARLEAPSIDHPFGTDHLGRDLLLRVIMGGRTALLLGVVTVALSMTLTIAVGVVAGYWGGRVDTLLSGLIDLLLALPGLLVTLAVLGILGNSWLALVFALVGTGWGGRARIIRSATLSIRHSGYVEAARSIGASHVQIVRRHLLPNLTTPILVLTSLELGEVLLVVSSLSFLGLGTQPPASDWGTMLAEGRSYFGQAPWLMWIPGLCIVFFSALANLAGDSLQTLRDRRRVR